MPKNRISLLANNEPLNRRELFTRAAGTAATLFVATSPLACGSDDPTDPGNNNNGTTGCVLTLPLLKVRTSSTNGSTVLTSAPTP